MKRNSMRSTLRWPDIFTAYAADADVQRFQRMCPRSKPCYLS